MRINRITEEETPLNMASLETMVHDHRTGAVHLAPERFAILAVTQNLGRTLIKVRWQAGGESLLLPEDIEGPTAVHRVEDQGELA